MPHGGGTAVRTPPKVGDGGRILLQRRGPNMRRWHDHSLGLDSYPAFNDPSLHCLDRDGLGRIPTVCTRQEASPRRPQRHRY
jgi:hypothetical protein